MNLELKEGSEEVKISFDRVIVGLASAKPSECPEASSSSPQGCFPGLHYEGVKTRLGELLW